MAQTPTLFFYLQENIRLVNNCYELIWRRNPFFTVEEDLNDIAVAFPLEFINIFRKLLCKMSSVISLTDLNAQFESLVRRLRIVAFPQLFQSMEGESVIFLLIIFDLLKTALHENFLLLKIFSSKKKQSKSYFLLFSFNVPLMAESILIETKYKTK